MLLLCVHDSYSHPPAPETVQHQKIGKPVDLWAAGCIIYLLLSGKLPFYDHNTMRLNMKIRRCQFEFPDAEWKSVSNEGYYVSCFQEEKRNLSVSKTGSNHR